MPWVKAKFMPDIVSDFFPSHPAEFIGKPAWRTLPGPEWLSADVEVIFHQWSYKIFLNAFRRGGLERPKRLPGPKRKQARKTKMVFRACLPSEGGGGDEPPPRPS
jgi:hypothetical protein